MLKKLLTFQKMLSHFFALAKSFGVIPAYNIVWMQFVKSVEYKHKYILSYLEKHYSKIISQRLCEFPEPDSSPAGCVVWVCWFQGEERMPATIKCCYESIKKYSGIHEVQLITFENYEQFISLPNHVIEKVENGSISLTHFSDIIRCNLLATYGGIYIDAGLYLSEELHIPQLPFYSIKHKKTNDDVSYVSGYRWIAGFMAGAQGNALHSFMRDFFNKYWELNSCLIDYFLVDYVIALAYNTIPIVRKMIDDVPYSNPDFYYLERNLFHPVNKEELEEVFKRTSVFKIGYKNFPEENPNGSLYNYLFKQANYEK